MLATNGRLGLFLTSSCTSVIVKHCPTLRPRLDSAAHVLAPGGTKDDFENRESFARRLLQHLLFPGF